MNMDLGVVLDSLDPDGIGGRHHIDHVATAIRSLSPHTDAAAVPDLVLDVVRDGERRGLWTAARAATVSRGRTTLPKFITLPRTAPRDALRTIGVPLRPELAPWAATLPLSRMQRDILLAVNDWLRRTDGGDTPVAEAAERAYEVLGDEKAFDSTPPRGGTTLWAPGRLTFQLLRCHRTPTPLTWEPTTPRVNQAGPVLCVENHATFRTLLRLLRAESKPAWFAVAWVQGRNTAPLESLADLPFTVTRLDYLGDFDPAGLSIAVAACAAAQRAGVAAGPAERLWALLLQQPHRPGRSASDTEARGLVTWLPEPLREHGYELLISGRAIPQEALRVDLLRDGELHQARFVAHQRHAHQAPSSP
jgi:hypothetical protein